MPPPARPRLRRAMRLATIGALTGLLAAPTYAEASGQVFPRQPTRAALRQSGDSFNRDVRIHNQTGWTMTYLYASSGGDWSGDLLGSSTLEPGASLVVTIDNGSGACLFSLRAEFDNGQSLQRSGVNACEIADFYYTR